MDFLETGLKAKMKAKEAPNYTSKEELENYRETLKKENAELRSKV